VRSYIAAACIVLGWLASPAPARAQAVRSDQDVLIQLERQWNDAFYRKDMAFLQNVLAEEYISTYEDGTKGDKAKELAETATFNQHVDSAKQEDFLVKVYGDTAVVWFSLRLTGPKQGKPTEVLLRYVDVFVMRDGRWQCVSSQSTKVTGQ
jgi:ketosteroid isomerase-like protein